MNRREEKITIMNNNAIILQNAINRMAGNSGLLKGLYLPFISSILATQFGLAFCNNVAWFNDWMNRVVFGILMFSLTVISTIVFMILDGKYLVLERKLRKIYDAYCAGIDLDNESDSIKAVDISKELDKQPVSKQLGWSIWLYYPVFCILINVVYLLLTFIIR